ncbi:MAG: YicC/YloC family endoribonuclease [bacterium]
MNSMTGFGKAEAVSNSGTFSVEISSVNSRYLEISVRMPRHISALEHKVRELINGQLNRGKIFIYIGFTESEELPSKSFINEKTLIAVNKQLNKIKKDLKIGGEITISDLLVFPDITRPNDNGCDEKAMWSDLEKIISKGLEGLIKMRQKEGAAMARDMKKRLTLINKINNDIVKNASLVVAQCREKLKNRINDMIQNVEVDQARLEQEIAFIADRCDISEECTRLFSHIKQFQDDLQLNEPVGKRLNFVLQEMNREANTIASKSNEISITSATITLKEEIEKLREMIQNVE